MNLKNIKNIFLQLTVLIAVVVFMSSCEDSDDATGHSIAKPTNPTIQISGPSNITNVEWGSTDASYEFSMELSEPQITDVKAFVNVEGAGVEGVDYMLSSHVISVPQYYTVGGAESSFTLTMIGSSARRESADFKIIVGDAQTANAKVNPFSVSAKLMKAPDCAFPTAEALVGTYTETNDDGTPQTATATITEIADHPGAFTISNFAFSSAWWCGHTDATMDFIIDNCANTVSFLEGEEQAPGNMADLCGYSGPVMVDQGDGTWDPDTGEIDISMEVTVDAGSFGVVSLNYTPQ